MAFVLSLREEEAENVLGGRELTVKELEKPRYRIPWPGGEVHPHLLVLLLELPAG